MSNGLWWTFGMYVAACAILSMFVIRMRAQRLEESPDERPFPWWAYAVFGLAIVLWPAVLVVGIAAFLVDELLSQ